MIQAYKDQHDTLIEILTCLICQNKAQQAHICPNCSKFFCYQCITNWIKQKAQSCPYCQESLNQKQLVNCHKLCLDLSNALETMKSNKNKAEKTCQTHNLELIYYCMDCQEEICSDCGVLSTQHSKHEIMKTQKAIKQFDKKIQKLKTILNDAKTMAQKQISQQKHLKQNLSHNLQKDIKKLNSFIKNLKDRITKKYNNQNQFITNLLEKQQHQIQQKTALYETSLNYINSCPKIHFISTEAQILLEKLKHNLQETKQSNKVLRENIYKLEAKPIENQILPNYVSRTFLLNNYSHLCRENQLIYSQSLEYMGPEWRLKIYPAGNQGENQQEPSKQVANKADKNILDSHASIFIQLKSSLRQKGKYRHKIIIQNLTNPNKNLQRQFQSQFQIGQCWGYDKFVKINYLYDNQFIKQDIDQLKITLMIAPANYYEATEDLNAYMKSRKQYLQKIKERRMALMGQEINQQ